MIIYVIFWNGLSIWRLQEMIWGTILLTSHLRTLKEFPESTPVVNQGPRKFRDLDWSGYGWSFLAQKNIQFLGLTIDQ